MHRCIHPSFHEKDRIMNLCAHPICGILPVNCPIPYKNARVCVPKNLMPSWKNTVLSKHTKLRKNQSLANVDCRSLQSWLRWFCTVVIGNWVQKESSKGFNLSNWEQNFLFSAALPLFCSEIGHHHPSIRFKILLPDVIIHRLNFTLYNQLK